MPSNAGAQAASAPQSIQAAALSVLQEPDPWRKAALTQEYVRLWRAGELPVDKKFSSTSEWPVPDRPARSDDKVRLVAPGAMPRLGKGGTLESRQAIVHSLCHIESWAVDLAWDAVARWGRHTDWAPYLEWQFYNDFVTVADDEARHFLGLAERLTGMGTHYGALPAHDGLWESATTTAHSLAARLAVEHCVHEARGLDVMPQTIEKFRRHGDLSTTALLEGTIYPEEVTHCAAGVRWLTHLHRTALQTVRSAGATPATAGPAHESSSAQNGDIDSSTATTRHANGQPSTAPDQACNHAHAHDQKNPSTTGNQVTNAPGRPITANGQVPSTCQGSSTVQGDACSNAIGSHCVPAWMSEASQFDTVQEWFHHLVRGHFAGALKPPFNHTARAEAGFDETWYIPLCARPAGTATTHAAAATPCVERPTEGGIPDAADDT